MTDAEMRACFDLEYGPDGFPQLKDIKFKQRSAFSYFEEECRDHGVTDPTVIAQLWRERQDKLKVDIRQVHERAKKRQQEMAAAQAKRKK